MKLLAARGIPLIEDDVYSELYFGRERPRITKVWDRKGLVLDCGSFAKSLAPGYRLGWIAAGQFATAVRNRKITTSLATSIPIQAAIARYLATGVYDRHLGRLRRTFPDPTGAARICSQAALSARMPLVVAARRLPAVGAVAARRGCPGTAGPRAGTECQSGAGTNLFCAAGIFEFNSTQLWPPLERPQRSRRPAARQTDPGAVRAPQMSAPSLQFELLDERHADELYPEFTEEESFRCTAGRMPASAQRNCARSSQELRDRILHRAALTPG